MDSVADIRNLYNQLYIILILLKNIMSLNSERSIGIWKRVGLDTRKELFTTEAVRP